MMTTSFFDLFERGGPVMWPILLCSIVALAIALERLVALSHLDLENRTLPTDVAHAIQSRQLAQVERLCDQNPGPLSAMVKAGVRRYGRPREEILETVEEAAAVEVLELERNIPLLGTIAHLSPLLGLLGTVTGLVRCFQVIQEKATTVNPVNPGDLAGGIWEALLTTVFGLLVAIPAYGMYNYLAYRINRLSNHLQVAATRLAALLAGGETQAPSSSVTASQGEARVPVRPTHASA